MLCPDENALITHQINVMASFAKKIIVIIRKQNNPSGIQQHLRPHQAHTGKPAVNRSCNMISCKLRVTSFFNVSAMSDNKNYMEQQ